MIVISAPFGNYLSFPNCLHILGTFTVQKRGGFLKRLWKVLTTVRYNWRTQSWINKLGLPTPSINSLKGDPYPGIVSIHGFNETEWIQLTQHGHSPLEFNLSCPNVNHKPSIKEVKEAINLAFFNQSHVICKLPPIRWMEYAQPLYDLGVRMFHCCNTIPTPGGGISGKTLKPYSLWATEEIKTRYPDCSIIGGGGVTSTQDVIDYLNAGADHVSIASMLFNPLNWHKVKQLVQVADI